MRRSEGFLKCGDKKSKGARTWKIGGEALWSAVKWSDDLGPNVLSLIYSYVAVWRVCSVRFRIICFCLLLSNYSTHVLLYSFYVCFLVLYVCFPFLSILCFFIVFYCFAFCFFIFACLFPIFVQVYPTLPPGGNPIAINISYNIISYQISHHITS